MYILSEVKLGIGWIEIYKGIFEEGRGIASGIWVLWETHKDFLEDRQYTPVLPKFNTKDLLLIL